MRPASWDCRPRRRVGCCFKQEWADPAKPAEPEGGLKVGWEGYNRPNAQESWVQKGRGQDQVDERKWQPLWADPRGYQQVHSKGRLKLFDRYPFRHANKTLKRKEIKNRRAPSESSGGLIRPPDHKKFSKPRKYPPRSSLAEEQSWWAVEACPATGGRDRI